jgi:hypothetical protein
MTTTISTRSRTRALGVCWLALGVPVGALIGWLLQISDNAQDRHFGVYLLALGTLSLVLGVTLVQRSRPRLRVVSLGASGLWVLAAGLAIVLADFPTDAFWGGGLIGLVAVATGALALVVRP